MRPSPSCASAASRPFGSRTAILNGKLRGFRSSLRQQPADRWLPSRHVNSSGIFRGGHGMESQRGLSTTCVHAGELADAHGAPHTPIYNSTTFGFPSTAALLDVIEGRREGALYSRYGLNPTIKSLEAKLAPIGSAEAA